ncbi:hypothetical protein ACHAP8_005058 [Fusarium lateritium]
MASLMGTTPQDTERSDDGVVGVNSDIIGASPIKDDAKDTRLIGPLLWSGQDFDGDQTYTLRLSDEEAREVDSALASFKALGLDGDKVSADNFPLPNLSRRLRASAETLHLGKGFVVIRGIDGAKYTNEDSVTIFLGVASYIGDKRGLQDRKGNMLFRHSANKGGNTYLSSAWTVFNHLLIHKPEVIDTLRACNWPVQLSGRNASFYLAPVFEFHDNKLLISLDPHRLGPHPKMRTNIPDLSEAQQYALQAVSDAAKQFELQLKLETGDLLFFNNLALVHRRDAYTDDATSSRHLVRLWLRSQKYGWAISDGLLPPWEAAYGENRRIKTQHYPIVPMPEYRVPKYATSSACFVMEDSESSDEEE